MSRASRPDGRGSRSTSPAKESLGSNRPKVSKLRRAADAPKLPKSHSSENGTLRSKSPSQESSVSSASAPGMPRLRRSSLDGLTPERSMSPARSTGQKKDPKAKSTKKKTEEEVWDVTALKGGRLCDVNLDEREDLLFKKLQTCTVNFDFRTDGWPREKEAKRQTLVELIDYVNNTKDGFSELAMKEAIAMVSSNIFRPLEIRDRTPMDMLDMDDEENAYQDPAWPHLQLVYEFLLKFVSSKHIEPKVAQKFLNHRFLAKLLLLLDSDDARERDMLKNIMLKYYSRFTNMRSAMRKISQYACLRAAYETDMPNGVAEMLELQIKVIAGFSTPLKQEHKGLLTQVLIPLHKVPILSSCHEQLKKCMAMFVEKDNKLCHDIVVALLSFWPWTCGSKQVLFIEEIEELLKQMPPADFERLSRKFIHRLTLCITCQNSTVAERALGLWNSGKFAQLINSVREEAFPPIISALYRNATQHWCGPVHTRTFDVLKSLMEADEHLFSESSAKHRRSSEEDWNKEDARLRKWAVLQELFDKKEKDRQAAAARARRKNSPKRVTAKAKNPRRESVTLQRRLDPALLEGANYGMSLSSEALDVDLQAVIVNSSGDIISVVANFNVTALNAAIVHSAGVPSKKHSNGNGVHSPPTSGIWVTLSRLPPTVRHLFFLVVAAEGATPRRGAGRGCTVRVVNGDDVKDVVEIPVELEMSGVSVVAAMECNDEADWHYARISMQSWVKNEGNSAKGAHFTDALEFIGALVRDKLPSAIRPPRVCLVLETTSAADFLQGIAPRNVFLGAGWDFKDRGALEDQGIAIDVSAVLFGIGGKELAVVCAENPEEFGVRHSGSGLLSAGVAMILDNIAEQVSQIYLVAHVSPGATYEVVQNPTCRMIDDKGVSILHYSIRENSWRSGLILGRLSAESGRRRWCFQAIGRFCGGFTCRDKETAQELQSLLRNSTCELQRQADNMKPVASTPSGRLLAFL